MKRVKADVILSAVLCVVLGVVLIIWPDTVTRVLCYLLGAVLIIMGIGRIIEYLIDRAESRFGLAAGIVLLLLGAWLYISPAKFVSLFPIIIGVVLLMHGLEDLKLTFETRGNGDEIWWSLMIISVLNFVFGILLVWNAYKAVTIAMMIVGIALIYDGLSDLFVVYRVVKTGKAAEEALEELASKNENEL